MQKIGKLWYISPGINIGINNEMIDQKQGNIVSDSMPIDSLSPEFIREHKHFETALSFKRSTIKTQFNLVVKAVWNQYGTTLWDITNNDGTWFNLLPTITYENRWRTGRRFLLRYSTGINIPSASQLLAVINNTNPIALYTGNKDLKPEYSQNFSFELSIFDQFSYTSMFLRAGGSYTKDKIGLSQTIDDNMVQMNSPVNVPWDYTAFGSIDFSTPMQRLGIKVNLTLNENWHRGINIVNSEDNTLNSMSHGINLTIENNLKQKMNARIGSSVSLTDTKYSIQETLNNLYFNTVYFGDLFYNPNDHWNLQLTARVTNYNSKSLDESLSIPQIDASISYYFLKGNRAGVTLKGIDLLDKNKGFQQISDINYMMQIDSNSIGRYIMLSFKYILNQMVKK
jgi:hypothetical protein